MTTDTRYPTRGLEPRNHQPAKPGPRSQRDLEAMAANWQERGEPTLLKLAEGECFIGVLAGVEKKTIGTPPQQVCQYTLIEEGTGDAWLLNGTYRIDSAIRKNDIGHRIFLRYEGEDQNVGRNGNKMKKYQIRIDPSHAPGWATDGTQITDADFPANF